MDADLKNAPGLRSIAVTGFKSIRDRTELEFRPLTVLAGANSSGKSSLMQPLLLAKQTLEAPFDPGVLLVNGPIVRLGTFRDAMWTAPDGKASDRVVLYYTHYNGRRRFGSEFHWQDAPDGSITSLESAVHTEESVYRTTDGISWLDGENLISLESIDLQLVTVRARLGFVPAVGEQHASDLMNRQNSYTSVILVHHLPGLRDAPTRNSPVTGVEGHFPGPFPPYTASLLRHWQHRDPERLAAVVADLDHLALTDRLQVDRTPGDDSSLQIRVGSQRGGGRLVHLTDVGLGISQVLPIVVALRHAAPGQVVHIEQPELHLHPNAQVLMADLLIAAGQRGVRVVIETHSSLMLRAIQLAVADGKVDPQDVGLHWFTRDAEGAAIVTRAELDEAGSWGDWPVDFADVEMALDRRYIDASFRAVAKRSKRKAARKGP